MVQRGADGESYPVGMLADRLGHLTVLVAGYALGAATAALTALAFWFATDSIVWLTFIFLVAGLYVAVQEALEATVTAGMVDATHLANGMGANGTAKFISSATAGGLWPLVSPMAAFGLAAGLMLAGALAIARVRR